MINKETDLRIQTVCLAILTIFAIFAVLKVLSSILVPFTMAVFLTLVLIPIVDYFIRKLKIRRSIALVLTMTIGGLVIVGTSAIISRSINDFQGNINRYEQQFTKLIDTAESLLNVEWIMSLVGVEDSEDEIPSGDLVPSESDSEVVAPVSLEESERIDEEDAVESSADIDTPGPVDIDTPDDDGPSLDLSAMIPSGFIGNALTTMMGSTMSIVGQGALVMMFAAFLLAGSSTRKVRHKGSVISEIETRVQKYIGLKVVISAMTGSLVYLILAVLGIDYALTFGVFTFILNFIPNVGSFIAVALPLPIILLGMGDGPDDISGLAAFLAIALPLCIQLAIGNFVEPKVMGDTLGLHPVMVLMSLVLWSFLWGFPGALLAVPMTSIAKIIFERIEVTRPIAQVMEGNLDSLDKS